MGLAHTNLYKNCRFTHQYHICHQRGSDFVKVERSKRIRRAMGKNTRNNDVLYKSGDKIYYKRPDRKE